MKARKEAFTLIELLIVVAIIAILAAIAVPNFLEAQTRSKVSRAKADIRTLATALESYSVDNRTYPFDITLTDGFTPGGGYYWYICNWVTTPIAYITNNKLIDPFRDKRSNLPPDYWRFRYVNYGLADFNQDLGIMPFPGAYDQYLIGRDNYGFWRITSSGPDATAGPFPSNNALYFPAAVLAYDPTNGTISPGDIVRCQKSSDTPSIDRTDWP